jgi:hypothetical protein
VIGAILLVGGIGLLDLRLLGYGKGISPAALSRAVTPLALAGLAIMVVSVALTSLLKWLEQLQPASQATRDRQGISI